MHHHMSGFYTTHNTMMAYNLPNTLHNLSGGTHSIKKLSQSENIVNFERLQKFNPKWKQTLSDYREFIKEAMLKENLNRPILTNYLSEQKLKKGIVDELTKNKGIEV